MTRRSMLMTIPALAVLAACTTMPTPPGPDAALTKVTSGRVAGPPRTCIPLSDANGSEVFDDAIVYRVSRKLLYVTQAPGCRSSISDPIIVQSVFGSQLCRGDLVRLVERSGGVSGPSCILGKFTPYRLRD